MADSTKIAKSLIDKSNSRRSGLGRVFSVVAGGFTTLSFLGLLVAGVAVLHMRAAADIPPQPHPAISVQTIQIQPEDGYTEVSFYVGRLEPARQTALAFERSGLVTSVAKNEGDTIKAGDVVAELDVAQLNATRRQFEAQTRELEARRELAELTLSRQSKLKNKGWASVQRFDEARANVSELAAGIDRVKAQISSLDIDISKSKLIAPFDGIISSRSIDEGAVVAPSTPIVTLLENARMQARVGLPPEKANTIKQDANYILRAGSHVLKGKLVTLRPDLQSGTRTVTALFDVTGGQAVPFGEIVTLELDSEVSEPGTWLPLTALMEREKGLWTVMVVEADEKGETVVRHEAAEILYAKDQSVFVRGTFKANAHVLSNGTNRVTNGQRVAIAKE